MAFSLSGAELKVGDLSSRRSTLVLVDASS